MTFRKGIFKILCYLVNLWWKVISYWNLRQLIEVLERQDIDRSLPPLMNLLYKWFKCVLWFYFIFFVFYLFVLIFNRILYYTFWIFSFKVFFRAKVRTIHWFFTFPTSQSNKSVSYCKILVMQVLIWLKTRLNYRFLIQFLLLFLTKRVLQDFCVFSVLKVLDWQFVLGLLIWSFNQFSSLNYR